MKNKYQRQTTITNVIKKLGHGRYFSTPSLPSNYKLNITLEPTPFRSEDIIKIFTSTGIRPNELRDIDINT